MDPFKAAVIGLGNIGLMYDLEPQRPHPSSHVLAYEQSNVYQLVCGIDSDNSKAKVLNSFAPKAKFMQSLDEALDSGELDGMDAISICTPPATHMNILERLIVRGAGQVLFCEKPLVSNIAEAQILKQLILEHGNVTVIPNISRRWNTGLREVSAAIADGSFGILEKINIRYTRGIYNTGTHLFDLLKMWSGSPIKEVMALGATMTSSYPEPSYSFFFKMENGVAGYAEAVDDSRYYLFEVDLYLSGGKIEMRNSGDDLRYYRTGRHHLFDGFHEPVIEKERRNLLGDACLRNAVENIGQVLKNSGRPFCIAEDAFYPLYVADALERSFIYKRAEGVKNE